MRELPQEVLPSVLWEDGLGDGEDGREGDKAGAQPPPLQCHPAAAHAWSWSCHVHIWSCLLPPFPGLPEEGIAHDSKPEGRR